MIKPQGAGKVGSICLVSGRATGIKTVCLTDP